MHARSAAVRRLSAAAAAPRTQPVTAHPSMPTASAIRVESAPPPPPPRAPPVSQSSESSPTSLVPAQVRSDQYANSFWFSASWMSCAEACAAALCAEGQALAPLARARSCSDGAAPSAVVAPLVTATRRAAKRRMHGRGGGCEGLRTCTRCVEASAAAHNNFNSQLQLTSMQKYLTLVAFWVCSKRV
jgi:hypothetical protein